MKKPQSTIRFFKTSPYDKQGRIRCWVREQYKPTWADVGRDIIKALGQRVRSRTARKSFASFSDFVAKERAVSLFHHSLYLTKKMLRWLTSPLLVIALVLYIFHPHSAKAIPAEPVIGLGSAPTIIDTKPVAPITTAPALPQVAELPMPPPVIAPSGTYANGYAPGWCTYGVASRVRIPNNWGDARSWFASAAAAGYSVGHTPKVGAIAQHSVGLGHVALVESLNPDGSFVIWEMNGTGGWNTTDTRTVTVYEMPNFIYVQ